VGGGSGGCGGERVRRDSRHLEVPPIAHPCHRPRAHDNRWFTMHAHGGQGNRCCGQAAGVGGLLGRLAAYGARPLAQHLYVSRLTRGIPMCRNGGRQGSRWRIGRWRAVVATRGSIKGASAGRLAMARRRDQGQQPHQQYVRCLTLPFSYVLLCVGPRQASSLGGVSV
jgi:hypothetical protein